MGEAQTERSPATAVCRGGHRWAATSWIEEYSAQAPPWAGGGEVAGLERVVSPAACPRCGGDWALLEPPAAEKS